MSAVSSPFKASSFPMQAHSFESLIQDLPSAITHLRAHKPEVIPFLKGVLKTQNEIALDSLIESHLLSAKDLESHAAPHEWFLEYYAGALTRFAKEKKERLFQYLTTMGLPLKEVFRKHPKLLSKQVLDQLVKQKKIPSDQRKLVLETPIFELNLLEILEEAILNIPFNQAHGRSSNILEQSPVLSFFKATPLLEKFIQNALDERKTPILKQLINKRLLPQELLHVSLSKDGELHLALLEELKKECTQNNQNQDLILFLMDAGLKVEDSEVYLIAKSGNYPLLKEVSNRGRDISQAVFHLIKEKSSILDLLSKGLDPNLKNQEGNTLLLEAVMQDKQHIVEDLLRYGANPLILDFHGRSVFDIAKEKSLETRRALYFPPELRSSSFIPSGGSWNQKKIAEEETLSKFLDRHSQSKPFARFFALFIKVSDVALALLKPRNPYPQMPNSYQEAFTNHPKNRISCWSSSGTYGIPENFAPNQSSMETLGFVIKEASKEDEEKNCVLINKRRYACIQLASDYKTKNPDLDQGFKYSYSKLRTHGHGKNPEALRSAFRQHREGVRLNWITTPNLTENREELATLGEQMNALFDIEEESTGQLTQLQHKVSSYIEKTESIVEARRTISSNNQKALEERSLVGNAYDSDIKEHLKNAHLYTFNEKRLLDWKEVIHRQIQSLQELEKKLLAGKSMDVALFEEERKKADHHLKSIRDMIASRSVTSSETPTLKIYMSSSLIEDIFASNKDSTTAIKKTLCQLIGTFLRKIPTSINQTLAGSFLDQEFRKQIMVQFHQEAQFITAFNSLPSTHDLNIKMQRLAIELTLLRDTSTILEQIPPISLTSYQQGIFHNDEILDQTMLRHLKSYASARSLLDELWTEVSKDQTVLEEHTDEILRLFTSRVLLIDEEVREIANSSIYYPPMDPHNPKRMLDEQLFLLASTLLVSLSSQKEKEKNPDWLPLIIEYLHLRLTPSFHGAEKKRYKPEGLFLTSLIDVISQIKDIVSAAWQSDKSEQSPFRRLNALLEDYHPPKKEELETELSQTFRKLSPDSPYLQLDPSIQTLVSKVRDIRSEIDEQLLLNSQNNPDISPLIEQARTHLDQTLKLFDCLSLGTTPSQMTIQKALEIIRHESSPNKRQLESALIEGVKSDIRSAIETLLQKTKGSFHLEQLAIDKVKTLQKECGHLIQKIDDLKEEKWPPPQDPSQFRKETLAILKEIKALSKGTLEKSINKLSPVYDKLNEENVEGIDIVLEVENLSKQLENFFKGKKGQKVAELYGTLPQKLSESIKPHLEPLLPLALKELRTSLEHLQKGIYSIYFKKLEKIHAQLRLGIREQTYYTTDQQNVSYYLWDGKPFDALPYHTDNEVHLPLEEDFDLRQTRQQLLIDSFPDRYPQNKPEEQLQVAHLRDFGHRSKRRRLSPNPANLK